MCITFNNQQQLDILDTLPSMCYVENDDVSYRLNFNSTI